MDGYTTANHGVVLDGHMHRKCSHIGNNDVVPQPIVMGDVAVSQNVVVGADLRHLAVACGAVNRNAFAKCVVIADFGSCQAALPFQVLSLQSDAGELKKFVAAADSIVPLSDA